MVEIGRNCLLAFAVWLPFIGCVVQNIIIIQPSPANISLSQTQGPEDFSSQFSHTRYSLKISLLSQCT